MLYLSWYCALFLVSCCTGGVVGIDLCVGTFTGVQQCAASIAQNTNQLISVAQAAAGASSNTKLQQDLMDAINDVAACMEIMVAEFISIIQKRTEQVLNAPISSLTIQRIKKGLRKQQRTLEILSILWYDLTSGKCTYHS